jgi:tRNA(Arg) A34 adenosine deaminase TadA
LVRNEEAEITTEEEATEADRELLRQAIRIGDDAVRHGNHPFGALLTDSDGQVVLTAENTVVTGDDVTGHAETNLVRQASRTIGRAGLANYTLYTSCEPCAMCSGAIYWAGIHRVVYALAEANLLAFTGSDAENPTLRLPCREVFARGQRTISVVGPLLEEEAAEAHHSFWR